MIAPLPSLRRWSAPVALAATLAVALPARALELPAGEHPVGVRKLVLRDEARTFVAPRDWRGETAEDDWARRIVAFVWYPAAERGEPVPLSLYFPNDDGPGADTAVPDPALVEGLARRHGRTESEVRALLDGERDVFRDAEPAPGRFPVILHRGEPRTGFLISEVLAGHGYVVVCSLYLSEMTRSALAFTPDPVSLDTDERDIELLASRLDDLPFADPSRIGLLAFSSASLPNLLFQARTFRASGIVAMEGWEVFRKGVDTLLESPFWDPFRIRVPYLLLEKAREEAKPEYAKDDRVWSAMRLAPRHRVTFRDAEHSSFVPEPRIFAPDASAGDDVFVHASALILEFFDATVRDGGDRPRLGPHGPTGSMTVDHLPAEAALPSEPELARLLELGRFGEAREALTIAATLQESPYTDSGLLRIAGGLPGPSRLEALAAIAAGFPRSTRAHYRLARGLEAAGDDEAARAAYGRAREIVESDPAYEGDDEAKASAREQIDARIARLP